MKDKSYKNRIKSGYTLLFSIIVASVVLSIAAFILSVSRKQFILSSVSRDSTMAIYAADSAMQCVISSVWNDRLSTSTEGGGTSVYCNGGIVTGSYVEVPGAGDPSHNMRNGDVGGTVYKIHTTSTPLGFDFRNDTCALVSITDGYDITSGKHKTIIESRGYNDQFSAPCTPGKNNPRTVERAIRLTVWSD